MFCKNRITLIGFLGKDAETRFTPNGTAHTRFYAEQRFMRSEPVERESTRMRGQATST